MSLLATPAARPLLARPSGGGEGVRSGAGVSRMMHHCLL